MSESQPQATAGPEGGFKIPSAFLGRRKKQDGAPRGEKAGTREHEHHVEAKVHSLF